MRYTHASPLTISPYQTSVVLRTPPFQCHQRHKNFACLKSESLKGDYLIVTLMPHKKCRFCYWLNILHFAKSFTCWRLFFFSMARSEGLVGGLAKLMTHWIGLLTSEHQNKLSVCLLPDSYRHLLLPSRLQKEKSKIQFFLWAATYKNAQQELKFNDSAKDCSVCMFCFFTELE